MPSCPTCGSPLEKGPLKVSLDTNIATRNGLWVQLSPQQAEILHVLSRGGFVSTDRLIAAVWGNAAVATWEEDDIPWRTTIGVQAFRMRERLKPLGVSIRGHRDPIQPGYKLVFEDDG